MIEITGQKFLKNYLSEVIKGNKIAHSYILCGPDGIGKSVFAMYMAEALLCKEQNSPNGSPSGSPCGVCNTCLKIEKNLHADVKIIDNGKKVIGVGDVRKLIDEINTKPYEGDRKIIIIKNAAQITLEGQNALLKTLEEPPSNVFIILLTERMEALLETIKSRCQLLRFERVSEGEINSFLVKRGYNMEKAKLSASLSDGIPGKALIMLDDKYLQLRRDTIEVAHKLTTSGPLICFELAKFFTDNKDEFEFIMDVLTTWNRDILVFKSIRNEKNILNKDYYDLIVEESQLLSYNRLDRILDTIKDTSDKVRQYANFQLAIEMMLLKFQEV